MMVVVVVVCWAGASGVGVLGSSYLFPVLLKKKNQMAHPHPKKQRTPKTAPTIAPAAALLSLYDSHLELEYCGVSAFHSISALKILSESP